MPEHPIQTEPGPPRRHFGEEHLSDLNLNEAVAPGQKEGAQAAVTELESDRSQAGGKPVGAGTAGRSCLAWVLNLLVILVLAGALGAASLLYVTRKAQEIRNRHPIVLRTTAFLPGEHLGGHGSQELTLQILRELDRLQPDNCLFVGHQLAKKELVEYLSALSRHRQAVIALGLNPQGRCQLADRECPLRRFQFSGLMEVKLPLRTQVLLAFNNRTREAVGFVGTFPFDVEEASQGEHLLLILRDFDQCSELYAQYAKLLVQKGRAIQ